MVEIPASMQITAKGPEIGAYRDRPIFEWLEQAGVRFSYDRIAAEDTDGTVPLSQLRRDEFVIAPGLIYRRVHQ